MHFTWKPDKSSRPRPPKIGGTLIKAGLINEEQLQSSLERQKKHPYLTLGQLISLLHKVSMTEIDAISVKTTTLPLVGPVLMNRLTLFAQKDRFAKDLDPMSFVVEVAMTMREFEVMHIDSRRYDQEGEEVRTSKSKRYALIQGKVLVTLTTASGESIEGRLHLRHDSITHDLEITDQDDFIKAEFYYDLRRLYTKTAAGAEN